MAVANTLFGVLSTRYSEGVLLGDDIYTQISSLKRSTENGELDRLHGLYHNAHHAPATGEEQKIALMLLCPAFNECSNPCIVGKVCEVYTYVSWNSGDAHKIECGWALHNLQLALHEYFACGAVQRGSLGWNGRFETWDDFLAYHVLGLHVDNFSCFNPSLKPFMGILFLREDRPRFFSVTEEFVQRALQLPVTVQPNGRGGVMGYHHEPPQAAGDGGAPAQAPESPNRWNRRRASDEARASDDHAWRAPDEAWRWKQYKGSWFFYCSCMDCWVKQKMETRSYCSWQNNHWQPDTWSHGSSWRWQ